MYRLTIGGDVPKRLLDSVNKSVVKSVTRRTYRWGALWGVLRIDTDEWLVETRTQVFSDDCNILMESIDTEPDSLPPPIVDDVWSDEVHPMPYGYCGNVCEIIGTWKYIQGVCEDLAIRMPTGLLKCMGDQPVRGRSPQRMIRNTFTTTVAQTNTRKPAHGQKPNNNRKPQAHTKRDIPPFQLKPTTNKTIITK